MISTEMWRNDRLELNEQKTLNRINDNILSNTRHALQYR